MKVKISVSMDESTIREIQDSLPNSIFRNKSHFIETAAKKYLKEIRNE